MQKKEIVLTIGLLAEKGACNRGIEEFKKWYPSGSAPLSEVLRKLQELANKNTEYAEYLKYVEYAKWLILHSPPTQETLVLNELTEKVIIHNGDVTIKKGVKGERFIIGNGELNIEDDVNLTGQGYIWAAETIKATNIAAYDDAGISAEKTIKAINVAAYVNAGISADETIDAVNIAAYDDAGILAAEINTQNIMDDSRWGIRGDINLIQPSSNPQNVTQPAN